MKKYFIVVLLFMTNTAFANLYLQTEYQEGLRPKVITKHHIFLNQKYIVNYSKRSYVLLLKKISRNNVQIETERYAIDDLGKKHMIGGSYGDYTVGKSFSIIDRTEAGRPAFTLKIVLEKLVPTVP